MTDELFLGASELEGRTIRNIAAVAMDAPAAAKSGHSGTAMALAPLATMLFSRVARHDPSDPSWPDRDRFILSCGHASILQYGIAHFFGYELSVDDLRAFRQPHSRTPGHPENGVTPTVEVTTGPLGQGIANGVGMALAERILRNDFGADLVSHRTWVIAGDGCLEEGISHEAASFAGSLGLDKLTVFYDDNHITIDGVTELALHDDAPARFAAYGWHVINLGEQANDLDALEAATRAAIAESSRPTLIVVRSHIGFPSPTMMDRREAHGSPFSAAAITEAKALLGVRDEPFALDPDLPEAHAALADYFTKDWTNQSVAEKELALARQGLPNDPDILLSLAACNLNLGRKSPAVQSIRQAAALDPQNGDTANFCALILDAASLYPEALAERDRAFRVSGWTGSLADKSFTIRNWKGDLTQALQTLDQSLASLRDPGDRDYYWCVRANFLRARGDFKDALAAIDHIEAELLPSQFYYHSKSLLRALVHEAMGETAAAREDYERARVDAEHYRDSNPRTLRACTSLALIYAGLGHEADARATIERGLDLVPPAENPAVASRTGLRVLAQIDARFGRTDAALETVRSQIAAGFWKRQDLLLDPDWALLRRDPRFLELAHKAEL